MGIEKFILSRVGSYLGIPKSQTQWVGYLVPGSGPGLITGSKRNKRPTLEGTNSFLGTVLYIL